MSGCNLVSKTHQSPFLISKGKWCSDALNYTRRQIGAYIVSSTLLHRVHIQLHCHAFQYKRYRDSRGKRIKFRRIPQTHREYPKGSLSRYSQYKSMKLREFSMKNIQNPSLQQRSSRGQQPPSSHCAGESTQVTSIIMTSSTYQSRAAWTTLPLDKRGFNSRSRCNGFRGNADRK